jgi:hypothetical protein
MGAMASSAPLRMVDLSGKSRAQWQYRNEFVMTRVEQSGAGFFRLDELPEIGRLRSHSPAVSISSSDQKSANRHQIPRGLEEDAPFVRQTEKPAFQGSAGRVHEAHSLRAPEEELGQRMPRSSRLNTESATG